jgi:hypothetical protein
VQIPAELITLNPDYLGNVDRAPKEVIEDERRKAWEVFRPAQHCPIMQLWFRSSNKA